MKITSYDLKELEIIDEIIPEPKGGAHQDIENQAKNIDIVLNATLDNLQRLTTKELLEKRWEKYKTIGVYNE